MFLRDHGVKTLYVVGGDGYAYSLKTMTMNVSQDTMRELVDVAVIGDVSLYPRSGIYRNMRAKSARVTRRLR